MNVRSDIDAGVCGFRTTIHANSDDGMFVSFDIRSDCEKIQGLAEILLTRQPVNAYEEISPSSSGVILATARECLPGCCAGCVVPVGIFKSLQVAAGLALPKDIHVAIEKEA
jgi:hypothetical protein